MKNFFSTMFTKKHTRVYLDNAGSTEISPASKRAFLKASFLYGNPSGIHKEGVEASLMLDTSRAVCATVLNAHAYEIYFVGSGTESCNLAVFGIYKAYTSNQKESSAIIPHMIVSSIEHPSILEPVSELEKKGLISVTYLPVYENGIVKVRDIENAIREETILISVMYANNEIGTLQPVKEIGRMLEAWKKEHGRTHTMYPYFHIDACQATNYCNLDVVRLRAHAMTVNSSKIYGPKGVALLYKREGVHMSQIELGGGQERGLRSGTENVAGVYAFAVALTETINMQESEKERVRFLRDYCKEELRKHIPSIIFYGAWDEMRGSVLHSEYRLPNNINCRVPGISSEEMILRLDARGFAVSHKSACASRETDGSYVVMALGVTEEDAMENIRISLGRETTKKDLDSFVQALKKIADTYTKNIS